jgi:aspartate/methionine/tyrosine aminotransferase
MIQTAERLKHIHEYYFSKKLREVRTLVNQGQDIINLGIGSPDLQPPTEAIKALKEAMQDPKAHQYQPYKGIPELRESIADFYKSYYNVDLHPEENILPLIGSKEGITHISMAFLNPGDEVLLPNPGYPTYTSVTNLVGAKPVFYELTASQDYQPDFEKLEKQVTPKTKLMWVSYPHMPTGAKPKLETFSRLKSFARKHNILVINDNPYSLTLNDKPYSFLDHLNTNEYILELNSLSKSFNLAGWRVGMLCGPQKLVDEVLKVKSNVDSGMFYGIQKGAIAAMNSPKDFIINQDETYRNRRELIWQLGEQLGLKYNTNSAGLFVWAKITNGKTSVEFSDDMLYNHQIFVTPGHIFGSAGEGYVRFSLCVDIHKIKTAIERTKKVEA